MMEFTRQDLTKIPRQLTSFVGRAEELSEIRRLLADPACRLLTLVGPGGIGKTRLAIEAAAAMSRDPSLGSSGPGSGQAFADGVVFVNLQPVQSTNHLISAIADALSFPLAGQDEPISQLLHYLRDRMLLLVLDNFEQLLSDPERKPKGEGSVAYSDEILTQMLAAAPHVKFLVTSREVLNMHEEWLFHVAGLSYPQDERAQDIPNWAAVELFVQRARQVRRSFALHDKREQDAVVRICQLLEGTPLALEMAASWTKTLNCAEIVDEIRRSSEFLSITLRNVPDRHRSMQAVFEHSWQLLSDDERTAFKRLSMFRGGFRREAAERVADASLSILSSLVDKSLLRWDPSGRYQVHELLRQYGEAYLACTPDAVAEALNLHRAYFCEFLARHTQDVLGWKQREAIIEIAPEIENIRAAWQRAAQQANALEIQRGVHTLLNFCDFQSRYREGADLLEEAAQALEDASASRQRDHALAEVLTWLGYQCIRLGRLQQARTVAERSLAIYQRLGSNHRPISSTDPLTVLGILACVTGDYIEAARLGEQSQQLNESLDDKGNLMCAQHVLTDAALGQGDYTAAGAHAQRARALAEEIGDRWFMAYVLINLGNIAFVCDNLDIARRHYESSYAIRKDFDDPGGMAVALNRLGTVALREKDYVQAQQLFRRSLALYRDISDQGGKATSLCGLGSAAMALGEYEFAREHLYHALQIAYEIQYMPLIFSTLIEIGNLLFKSGQIESAFQTLMLPLRHPTAPHEAKAQAQAILDELASNAPATMAATVSPVAPNAALDAEIESLLVVLAAPTLVAHSDDRTSDSSASKSSEPMIEPLTPREMEVLRLIAQGYTNEQIARQLVLSVGTVKAYTSQVYGKLGVNNRTQAAARARELKLLV